MKLNSIVDWIANNLGKKTKGQNAKQSSLDGNMVIDVSGNDWLSEKHRKAVEHMASDFVLRHNQIKKHSDKTLGIAYQPKEQPAIEPGQRFVVGDLVIYADKTYKITSVIDAEKERVPREIFVYMKRFNERYFYNCIDYHNARNGLYNLPQKILKACPSGFIELDNEPSTHSFESIMESIK